MRAALLTVRVLKWLMTALAVCVVVVGLVIVTREAFHDADDPLGLMLRMLAGGMVTLMGVGLLWAILMLPLWLIGGYLTRQESAARTQQ